MKILVVEDDFISRRLLSAILTPYGTIDYAVDGREALEFFKFALEIEDPYKLICLDIMIPEVDGYEVLKEIRRLEDEKGISESHRAKIVVTTAINDPRIIKRAFNKRCDDYLVKPFTKQKVISALQKLALIED